MSTEESQGTAPASANVSDSKGRLSSFAETIKRKSIEMKSNFETFVSQTRDKLNKGGNKNGPKGSRKGIESDKGQPNKDSNDYVGSESLPNTREEQSAAAGK